MFHNAAHAHSQLFNVACFQCVLILITMMQVTTSATVIYHDPSSDILLVGSLDFVLQAFDCKQRLGNTHTISQKYSKKIYTVRSNFHTGTSFGHTSSKIQYWTLLVQNQEK